MTDWDSLKRWSSVDLAFLKPHLRPLPRGAIPGQDREAKIRPQGHLECANPWRSPGEWSGMELTDT